MMKKSISTILFICFVLLGYGKKFDYSSSIKTDHPKGYQQIDLSPQLLGQLSSNYSDLRLLDSNQNEVPYVLRKEPFVSMKSFFREYPLLTNSPQPNGTSVIIFNNPNNEELSQISFVVKNNAVNKSARLSGSNDQKNWFLIRDHIHLHSMHNSQKTSELKLLNFPRTDYSYFKLEINDSNSLPIQFEQVGYYDYQSIDGLMTKTSMSIISHTDSASVSYLFLKFDHLTHLERIHVEIKGSAYYYRLAHFKVRKTRTTRKGKKQVYFENLSSVYLNSNTENIFEIGPINLSDLYLEIENGDDQPLLVESVQTYLLKNYLVAELDPTMQYQLAFGNPKIHSPKYDLQHFKNDIPKQLPTIAVGAIISNQKGKTNSELNNRWFDNKWLIWSVIGLVGIILAVISFSMIKEINQRDK
jgi:hypothetical protein